MLTTTDSCDNIKILKQPTVVKAEVKMKGKIFLVNILTVLSALLAFVSLTSMNGITLTTLGALACSYLFIDITVSLVKTENLLRKSLHQSKRTSKNQQAKTISMGYTTRQNQVA